MVCAMALSLSVCTCAQSGKPATGVTDPAQLTALLDHAAQPHQPQPTATPRDRSNAPASATNPPAPEPAAAAAAAAAAAEPLSDALRQYRWLDLLQLGHLAPTLQNEGLDQASDIIDLEPHHVEGFGLQYFERKRLRQVVTRLQELMPSSGDLPEATVLQVVHECVRTLPPTAGAAAGGEGAGGVLDAAGWLEQHGLAGCAETLIQGAGLVLSDLAGLTEADLDDVDLQPTRTRALLLEAVRRDLLLLPAEVAAEAAGPGSEGPGSDASLSSAAAPSPTPPHESTPPLPTPAAAPAPAAAAAAAQIPEPAASPQPEEPGRTTAALAPTASAALDESDVGGFLRSIGLGRHVATFAAESMSIEALAGLARCCVYGSKDWYDALVTCVVILSVETLPCWTNSVDTDPRRLCPGNGLRRHCSRHRLSCD
jgi:hypothetical protein